MDKHSPLVEPPYLDRRKCLRFLNPMEEGSSTKQTQFAEYPFPDTMQQCDEEYRGVEKFVSVSSVWVFRLLKGYFTKVLPDLIGLVVSLLINRAFPLLVKWVTRNPIYSTIIIIVLWYIYGR